MAQLTYTYDASKIAEHGLDQMRFELGDTMVDGGVETCALSDQEYKAVIISIHALREEGDSKNRDKISIFKQIIQHSARI